MTFLSTYLNPCFKIKKSISNKIKDKKVTEIGVIQKVHSLRREGGRRSLKSKQKQTGGGGVLACAYVHFLKKKC